MKKPPNFWDAETAIISLKLAWTLAYGANDDGLEDTNLWVDAIVEVIRRDARGGE